MRNGGRRAHQELTTTMLGPSRLGQHGAQGGEARSASMFERTTDRGAVLRAGGG